VRLLAERVEVYLEGLRESRSETEKAGDPDTVDLLTGAILEFEKHDWFLRATFAGGAPPRAGRATSRAPSG
jgi:starvation-inducible DNA-binding protein